MRYALYTPRSTIAQQYLGLQGVHALVGDLIPNYNVSPGKLIAIVRAAEARPMDIQSAWWGGRPKSEATPAAVGVEMVAAEYGESFRHGRCLAPANGWYAWDAESQPHYISRLDGELLWFASIWLGEGIEQSAIIITEVAGRHAKGTSHEIPLCLDWACAARWLSLEVTDRQEIKRSARRIDPRMLTRWPVSLRINNPELNDPDLVAPI